MRNGRSLRALVVLMVVIVATALLGGCAPKVKADESVKIMAKGMLTLEFTDFDKLGIKKEEQNKLKESVLNLAKVQAKNMLMAMANVKISDEQAQQIASKIYETHKKSAISTKLLSEEGKTAVVELSIQPVDAEKMAISMESIVQEKVQGLSEAEIRKQAGKIITDAYIEGLDKVEFKNEPAVIKVQCKLDEKENQWIPEENGVIFGAKIGQIMWGMSPE